MVLEMVLANCLDFGHDDAIPLLSVLLLKFAPSGRGARG